MEFNKCLKTNLLLLCFEYCLTVLLPSMFAFESCYLCLMKKHSRGRVGVENNGRPVSPPSLAVGSGSGRTALQKWNGRCNCIYNEAFRLFRKDPFWLVDFQQQKERKQVVQVPHYLAVRTLFWNWLQDQLWVHPLLFLSFQKSNPE